MAKKKRKVRKLKGYAVRSTAGPRVVSKGFPTLADVRKQAGPQGLLDPKLREGITGRIATRKEVLGR